MRRLRDRRIRYNRKLRRLEKFQKGTIDILIATPVVEVGIDIPGANSSTYTINNAQQSNEGQYSVRVTNGFGSATSNSATLNVTPFNANPAATIISPVSGTLYRSGDIINFSASAIDPEDGILPDSAFNWMVEFHHNDHLHPGPYITPGIKNGAFEK